MTLMPKKPGKPTQLIQIGAEWEDAIGQAIQKPKPPEGWPKPEAVPQRAPLNPKTGPRPKKKGGK